MSNLASIQPTIFTDQRTGDVSYGVRVFDDHGKSYVNDWDSIPDDDMDVLRKVFVMLDDITVDILNHICEEEKGIMIGTKFYDWDKIKHVFEEFN